MSYDDSNRMVEYNGEEVKYDADGNMTFGPLDGEMAEYTYDCRNRLVKAGSISEEIENMVFCCENMKNNIYSGCNLHEDGFECPDTLIYYNDIFDEYGIIIHDGGTSYIIINYCPWCGRKLPKSKRNI